MGRTSSTTHLGLSLYRGHIYYLLKRNFFLYGNICGLSIISPNGTYVEYYPSGLISLSRPHLLPSKKKFFLIRGLSSPHPKKQDPMGCIKCTIPRGPFFAIEGIYPLPRYLSLFTFTIPLKKLSNKAPLAYG